jgi:cytosine/adenosine deaminase-related metal-dependent hydrolase
MDHDCMRLDSFADSFYILSSLWGVLPASQVCSSSPPTLSNTAPAREIVRPAAPKAAAAVTAFVDVNVIPMDTERVLANHTVLVEGGRITALGPSGKVPVPAGAVRIDGRGKYLIPGLADMHTHYDHMSQARLRDLEYRMFVTLASGVTTIRELNEVPRRFLPLIRHLNSAAVAGPHILISPWIEAFDRPTGPRLDSLAAEIAGYKAAGYDFIQIPSLGRPLGAGFDSLVVVARRLGLPVASHNHVDALDRVLALMTFTDVA